MFTLEVEGMFKYLKVSIEVLSRIIQERKLFQARPVTVVFARQFVYLFIYFETTLCIHTQSIINDCRYRSFFLIV